MSTPASEYTIRDMTAKDLDEVTLLRKKSWIETYQNEEFGIDKEWVETYFAAKAEMSSKAEREERFDRAVAAGTFKAWVAVNADGVIIGTASALITRDDLQRVGMLYVEKTLHGGGLGAELMKKILDWFDLTKPIELEVVTYNDRAKAFYRKWGFREDPADTQLHKEKLPEIRMIRQPDNQQGAS